MSQVDLHIIGEQDFFKKLKEMGDYSRSEMNKIVSEAATITHREAVGHINNDNPSGREYFTRRKGKAGQKKGRRAFIRHIASAEGEFPATNTGRLVKNIKREKEDYGYTVGSRKGAPHGFFLELKSPSRGGRPWLSRAFETMKSIIMSKYGGFGG